MYANIFWSGDIRLPTVEAFFGKKNNGFSNQYRNFTYRVAVIECRWSTNPKLSIKLK